MTHHTKTKGAATSVKLRPSPVKFVVEYEVYWQGELAAVFGLQPMYGSTWNIHLHAEPGVIPYKHMLSALREIITRSKPVQTFIAWVPIDNVGVARTAAHAGFRRMDQKGDLIFYSLEKQ